MECLALSKFSFIRLDAARGTNKTAFKVKSLL